MPRCNQCRKDHETIAAAAICEGSHLRSVGGQRLFSTLPNVSGCSYREWLIGVIAGGLAAALPLRPLDGKALTLNHEPFASACVKMADAVIAELDDEE
jgi:hypothetical protein